MKKMNRDNWEEKKKELTEQFLRRFHKTDLIIPLIVMAVLVIVVVIVTLFFRQTEIRHVKESVYTYIFDTPSVMEDGLTLKDTKDGVYLRQNKYDYPTDGYIYYYSDRDACVLTDHFLYYDYDGRVRGRLGCQRDLVLTDGQISAEGRSGSIHGGFLYNGKDSYMTLEDATVEAGDTTVQVGAFSSIMCYGGTFLTVYPYGEKEAVVVDLSDPTVTATVKLSLGITVDVKNDVFYQANGVKNLLITSPMVFDEYDWKENTDEE